MLDPMLLDTVAWRKEVAHELLDEIEWERHFGREIKENWRKPMWQYDPDAEAQAQAEAEAGPTGGGDPTSAGDD